MTEPIAVSEFRLDGRTLVRLFDADRADEAAVAARLGLRPLRAPTSVVDGAPDLVLRYVDELPISGRIRTAGRDEGAWTDDAFVIRRGSRPVALVPFEAIGRSAAEILVVRGTGAPAKLVSLLNLALLGGERIAVHAAAVVHGGLGIAACGWSGSGKTEVLLAFTDRGARYVGDEWIHASAAGMTGLPTPVRVQDWHLEQLPELRAAIGRGTRLRLTAAGAIDGVVDGLSRRRIGGSRRIARLARPLAGRRWVDVPPARLFGADRIAAGVPLDRLFLLETGFDETVRVEPIDPATVADRLALAHVHHRRELLSWYWQSRYAFPERTNELLEQSAAVERRRLAELFAGRPAYRVEHPHSVSLVRLTDEMERALS
jgi:hypothetical protein